MAGASWSSVASVQNRLLHPLCALQECKQVPLARINVLHMSTTRCVLPSLLPTGHYWPSVRSEKNTEMYGSRYVWSLVLCLGEFFMSFVLHAQPLRLTSSQPGNHWSALFSQFTALINELIDTIYSESTFWPVSLTQYNLVVLLHIA